MLTLRMKETNTRRSFTVGHSNIFNQYTILSNNIDYFITEEYLNTLFQSYISTRKEWNGALPAPLDYTSI